MTFTFSIRKALKQSWQTFAAHPVFFSTLSLVMIIFNLFTSQNKNNIVLMILVIIAAILWSYVWISVSLAAVDGKDDVLNFKSLSLHMPNVREFFMIVLIGLCVGITVGIGFVLLIIPGIYFMTRLMFANISYVDRQGSVKASLNYSWNLVKGKIFWTTFLVLLIEIFLMILGYMTLMVGMLITYPLAMLLITNLYRALTIHHRKELEQAEV